MIVYLHSFYWICLIGKNMPFNVRENIQVFKTLLDIQVIIFGFLSTFQIKNRKHHVKKSASARWSIYFHLQVRGGIQLSSLRSNPLRNRGKTSKQYKEEKRALPTSNVAPTIPFQMKNFLFVFYTGPLYQFVHVQPSLLPHTLHLIF